MLVSNISNFWCCSVFDNRFAILKKHKTEQLFSAVLSEIRIIVLCVKGGGVNSITIIRDRIVDYTVKVLTVFLPQGS